jgi:poly-gamma-glutamate synthesis protein (capsule biosynthesis protein)
MQERVTVVAVGDLQLGDSPICVGYGFSSRYTGRPLDGVFADVQAAFANADIVFGNLETTLSFAGVRRADWRSQQMRGEPAFAAALRAAKFTVLNVANNHAVQHGNEAFEETLRVLEAAGIATCGVRGAAPWSSRPLILEIAGGTRIGVLGYCQRPRQYHATEPPFAEATPGALLADVRRLRGEVHHVLVSLHWGEEFVAQPSADEVHLARSIIDAGATMVLGHHPHVLRPIEKYRNGVIAYSLGNLVGDMLWYDAFRHGVIARCRLKGREPPELAVMPTYLDDDYVVRVGEAKAAPVVVDGAMLGLLPAVYRSEVRRTVRAQRVCAYRYALKNLWRYPLGALLQLAGTTLRHKLAAIGQASGLSNPDSCSL